MDLDIMMLCIARGFTHLYSCAESEVYKGQVCVCVCVCVCVLCVCGCVCACCLIYTCSSSCDRYKLCIRSSA